MGFFGGGGGTTPVNMVGASSGTAGTAGYVPAPAAGNNTRALFSDASFAELPLLPQYKNTTASRWVGVYLENYNANTGGCTIKVRNFHLIYIPASGQIDTLSFRTASAPSPAFNVHLALWNVNEDGTVGTYLIGATGSTGTSANTNINISVTATNVSRGFYWMSFTPDATQGATPLAFSSTAGGIYNQRFLGGTSLDPNNYVVWFYTCNTSYDQTTHETFTLNNNSSGIGTRIPLMGFQYV